jgi:hypothetical protein
VPAVGFLPHVGAALPGQPVELRVPPGVRELPLGGQQPLVLEPVQRGVERALRDLDDVAGNLLEALGDRVAVERPQRDDLEDKEIERALREIGLG